MASLLFVCLAVVGILSLFGAARRPARGGPNGPTLAKVGPPGQPVSFGYKSKWLAVACDDARKVIDALAISGAQPAGWPEGVAAAHAGGDRVFVTPPIEGTWVLVVSTQLPEPGAALVRLIERVSRELATEVQAFHSHRVVECHGWLRARAGKLVRAYAWLGEQGRAVLEAGEATSVDEGLDVPDEDDVMHVAAAWSVDPSMLGQHPVTGTGWLGIMERSEEEKR